MKTFLTILLLFPLLCGAQELPDSVSWFRINGKTYYSRDSKGKFIPAVVEYELADKTHPDLGYGHNVRMRDSIENTELVIGVSVVRAPQYFIKPFGKRKVMCYVYIDNAPKDIDDDFIYRENCKDGDEGNVMVACAPNQKNNKILEG